MARRDIQALECKKDGSMSISHLGLQWSLQDSNFCPGGLFASVGQMGSMGFGVSSPNPSDSRDENGGFKVPYSDLCMKYLSFSEGFKIVGNGKEEGVVKEKKKKKDGLKIKLKVSNPSLRRLISGAIAGAISRTAVAPLETIRTHLMVESSGHSSTDAAGAISSTATFPLEVAHKHIQVGAVSGRAVYKNVIHALVSILEQDGIHGLYKGLGPSCMKLVPAAEISCMCYEACKRILIEAENEE
ncbi:hypothetical protein H5410_045704 [Solanum commersonii]|uniref:Mitochondrial carrier protein n=1 Tax=Solanum commersonii TaxID=4109 RepID=A0A9J5XDH7_SOLCO|nr:hypothetical protein H5410_045704 [Solanum commersonii]